MSSKVSPLWVWTNGCHPAQLCEVMLLSLPRKITGSWFPLTDLRTHKVTKATASTWGTKVGLNTVRSLRNLGLHCKFQTAWPDIWGSKNGTPSRYHCPHPGRSSTDKEKRTERWRHNLRVWEVRTSTTKESEGAAPSSGARGKGQHRYCYSYSLYPQNTGTHAKTWKKAGGTPEH